MVLLASSLLACGCAPWSTHESPNYVTIEADSRHDTKHARKAYQAARKEMDKYVLQNKSDLAKAEASLRQALAADVRFGPAHHSLGILYTWQKQLYLAAWEFEYAARLMPERFEPLNNLGLVYESVGKYDQAKSFYLLAREKAPNNPEVISNLARCSLRGGADVDSVRPILEDVLATNPRTEWRCWAAEKLGLNPMESAVASAADATPQPVASPVQPESVSVEELPLIPPPLPGESTPPVSERTILPLPPVGPLINQTPAVPRQSTDDGH